MSTHPTYPNGHAVNGHAPTVALRSAPPPAPTAPGLADRMHHARAAMARIEQSLSQIIIGQEEIVAGVVQALVAGGHVLLEGAPGLGKTHLVRSLAQLIGGHFSRIQFTPDLMPSDVLGTSLVIATADGGKDLQYRKGPIFANLVLADEINRATPKTQSALLEAMAERTVSVEGRPLPLPSPFFVLATQNPIEMEGVYPLPEAQLDRFLVKLIVKMPTLETLARIGARTEEPGPSAPVTSLEQLQFVQGVARMIPAAPHVEEYAAKIVLATHATRAARYGAGPRAMQALMACGRARALAAGRAAVAGDDVAAGARTVLRHRIGLRFEAEAEGLTTDAVVDQILRTTVIA